MWKLYHQEQEPRHKAAILEKIASVQPFLSAYYEATKMVIKEGRNNDSIVNYNFGSKIEELDNSSKSSFDDGLDVYRQE